MANLTDQLRLVEKTDVKTFFLFARSLVAHSDYYQIVFRKNEGSFDKVDPYTPPLRPVKVRQGDTILHIYTAPRDYSLTGIIVTKDHYRREYELVLQLTVSDPERIAFAYVNGEDPARQTINTIKYAFENYASSMEHQKIPGFLPVDNWILINLPDIGLKVEQKEILTFHEDPHFIQQEMLQKEATIQDLQKEIQIRQDLAQKKLEHQKQTIEHLYTICHNLRQAAADEITGILRERIREGFERGYTTTQISDEFFALLRIFGDETHTSLEDDIIASMPDRKSFDESFVTDAKQSNDAVN